MWLRRRSFLPVMLVGGVVVALLFFNEETSIAKSRELDKEIAWRNKSIAIAKDSAEYYRNATKALQSNSEDLESVARETYHMQRASEDVFIVE